MREDINWKSLLFPLVFSLIIVFLLWITTFFSRHTKIVFCDVGQGDAAYIRVKNRADILIDAGPDNTVASCLGKHMPFYDRTIEFAFLSHPQKDHIGGFDPVLDHYRIRNFFVSPLTASSAAFDRLRNRLIQSKTKIKTITADDRLIILQDSMTVFWPTKEFSTVQSAEKDSNDFSLIVSFQENDFIALFSGDASSFALNGMKQQSIPKLSLLKIPHHGSKYGLTKNFLQLADPRVGVISVGKNNSYEHPSKEVMEMLKASKIKVLRTDEKGDIVFKL